MRNKIYNFIWYKIFKPLISVCEGEGPLRDYKRIKFQLALARLFPGEVSIILGDSEVAMFDNYKTMSKFTVIYFNQDWGIFRKL